ncbi:MAG TPA: hypothetical protein VK889_01320 [Solirubrobacterales bacterium]|nr:hypothetical protein [Solirubrobacterales bacterium]
MTLAWVPPGTTPSQLAAAGFSPGLMSAGLGSVPAAQTRLDLTQGNRVFGSLYKEQLPAAVQVPLDRPIEGGQLSERAESAPAEIEPGLLAESLARARAGERFEVRAGSLAQLATLPPGLRGDDLLIAIERPPPAPGEALAIGIAGPGFDGNLTSASTRLEGYVLSTDVAPTILRRLGAPVPSQMSGQPIEVEGSVDPAAVEALGERLASIGERRGPVIGLTLLAWLTALGAVALASRGSFVAHQATKAPRGSFRTDDVQKEPRDGVTRVAVRMTALAIVYLPLALLLAAALEPSQGAEQLLALVAPPLLAALTLATLGGYRALALAVAATVLVHAVDVIAGSPLTSLSLLGPNPGLGVRFYGIGNELEAVLAVLVVAGTGAGIAGFAPRLSPRASAAAFLALGLAAAFVFAAGRFGADVGAAIVLPAGAAVAAAAIAARRRRTALLAIAVPFAALALLALVDLLSGADAHLTRSVLDAGGLGELADVAQRRLQLSARSFVRPVLAVFLPLVLVLAVLAYLRRDRLAAWLVGRPAMRAGLLGALAAVAVGTLANDSGALLLVVGAAYLLVFTGFAWAESS